MSVIPNKIKEELIDVGEKYNAGSCIITHPNSFIRLEIEIIKICNENKELKSLIKDLLNQTNKDILPIEIKNKIEKFDL